MYFGEVGVKRKVRFHPAGEERIKKQQLEGVAYVPVPDDIADAPKLWEWIKEMKPTVHCFLAPDGWRQVGDAVAPQALPDAFDFHFREAVPTGTTGKEKFVWMEHLLSQIDCWGNVTLKPENYINPLPWPFLPVEKNGASDTTSPASGASSSASGSASSASSSRGFSLRMLDLGDNETIQAIWGKESAVKIIERECYKELWKLKVEPLFNQGRRVAVLVLGNPGVGKTAFLLYLLVILLRAKKKVLLRTKGSSLYYFQPDAAGNYDTSLAASYAEVKLDRDRDIYFLADGRLPDVPVFLGKAFLACTPLRANYKDYEKDAACRTFYLPVWSGGELALLRQEVFPEKDLQATKNRYLQWGGSPRHVLEITSKDLQPIIQKMAALENVVTAVAWGDAESNHPSHKILYMRILGEYEEYDLQYASPFVRKAVYQKLHQNTLRAFVAFKGMAMQGFGSLKGGILQEHFKHVARGTKQFRVCEVFEDLATNSPASKMETFNFGQPVEEWSVDDLTSKVYDRIIWPENPIEETIDALRITKNASGQDVLQCFQVTVSSERHGHGLKYNGIVKLMDKFHIPVTRVEVYIVTTNELFGDAGWQNWRIKNSNVLRDMNLKQRLQGIRQFAVDSMPELAFAEMEKF